MRLTQQIFKDKLIGEATKDAIRATGSRSGIMYGLPKVHKADTPLKPILSTKATYIYGMSQLLVKRLTPIIDSKITVSDSFDFLSKNTHL